MGKSWSTTARRAAANMGGLTVMEPMADHAAVKKCPIPIVDRMDAEQLIEWRCHVLRDAAGNRCGDA